MIRRPPALFVAFAGATWLAVAFLGAELCAVARFAWVERHNELVLVARGLREKPQTNLPPPLHDRDGLCQACAAQSDWNTFSRAGSLPAWAEPPMGLSQEESRQRRSLFAGLDEQQRQLFALINDEIVLALDAQGNIARLYGAWMTKAPFDGHAPVPLLQTFGKCLQTSHLFPLKTAEAYLSVSAPPTPDIQNDKEVLLLKGHGREAAYAFVPGDLRTIRFNNLPADTPWDTIPFFRYKKNLRNCRSGLGVLFDTNNFGFRGRDIAVPKPAGTLRLLCIGSSTTEEGPTNDTTYPQLVEKALNTHREKAACVEVVNGGVSGMTTSAHLGKLADYLAVQPDMIVVYEGVNDIHRDLAEYWRSLNPPWYRRMLSLSRCARWKMNAALYPSDETMRRDIRGLYIENLRAMAQVARSHNIRLAICSIASPSAGRLSARERAYYDYAARGAGLDPCLNLDTYERILKLMNREILALCQEQGFFYIPVAEHMEGGYDCFTDIYHMTPAAIERKAEIVSECLRAYLRPVL